MYFQHVVNEGEPLFLVDNSNSEQWKVNTVYVPLSQCFDNSRRFLGNW